jgi:hypothetical protein
LVTSHDAASDAIKPQAALRRSGDVIEPAPSHCEHLGHDVRYIPVPTGDPATYVTRDRCVLSVIKRAKSFLFRGSRIAGFLQRSLAVCERMPLYARHHAESVNKLPVRINEIPERGELYWESYRLCYIRSPEGIVVELAEQIG